MPDVAVLDPNAPLQTSADTPPPNASAQTDWGKGWVKDGAFDHAAFDSAPDDFKAYRKELETFKDVPSLADDRYFAPDIAHATSLVTSGALVEPLGDLLPTLLGAR